MVKKKKKAAGARVTAREIRSLSEAVACDEVENGIFENVREALTLSGLSVRNCIFRGVDFSEIELENCYFFDVVFERCNLAGKRFEDRLLQRVEFRDCKLLGAMFTGASLKDVTIERCVARYVRFAGVDVQSMTVIDSDFSYASFSDNEVKDLLFDRVELERSEILQTCLRDVDVSTCNIAGLTVDHFSLQGMIIDVMQSHELVRLLGVRFAE